MFEIKFKKKKSSNDLLDMGFRVAGKNIVYVNDHRMIVIRPTNKNSVTVYAKIEEGSMELVAYKGNNSESELVEYVETFFNVQSIRDKDREGTGIPANQQASGLSDLPTLDSAEESREKTAKFNTPEEVAKRHEKELRDKLSYIKTRIEEVVSVGESSWTTYVKEYLVEVAETQLHTAGYKTEKSEMLYDGSYAVKVSW